eukprot:GHVP01054367.1.p1 GENE.GHVP01054367.1~~GHVP01054367.1.p1  ORF type:complete len:393 (+),score=84.50 GHVP01054367.1:2-1180(+)
MEFSTIGLDRILIKQLEDLQIQKPTPIQKKTIKRILKGESILGHAPTGQGKSLCFVLPILQRLFKEPYGIFAVVLAPTREIAKQIKEQFLVVSGTRLVRISLVIGGEGFMDQMEELNGRPHIVVATPGRLKMLLNKNQKMFNKTAILVMDEVDLLLASEASDEIKEIISFLPEDKQTILFTATITEDVIKYTSDNKMEIIKVEASNKIIDEKYILIPELTKETALFGILKGKLDGRSIIIFVKSCKKCEWMVEMLNELGLNCIGLNSKMNQEDRFDSVTKFKKKEKEIFICTDLGSRGLDMPFSDCVINFDIPKNRNIYIHRIGRTGRRNRSGLAISFVCQKDKKRFLDIEGGGIVKMEEYNDIPNQQFILKYLDKVSKLKITVETKVEERY